MVITANTAEVLGIDLDEDAAWEFLWSLEAALAAYRRGRSVHVIRLALFDPPLGGVYASCTWFSQTRALIAFSNEEVLSGHLAGLLR